MKEQTTYLVSNLPIKDKFLKDLSFSDPTNIASNNFTAALTRVAKTTRRFTDVELQNLDNQLKLVQLAPNLPKFEAHDTFDYFWLVKVPNTLTQSSLEDFTELSKLMKLISIIPNSQAFVERSFNDTKRIADSKENLAEVTMTSLKLVLDMVCLAESPELVHIPFELIIAHQHSKNNYEKRLQQEKKEKELAEISVRKRK